MSFLSTIVVIMHAKVDMQQIKEEYYKRNNVTLEMAIIGDTYGDYE